MAKTKPTKSEAPSPAAARPRGRPKGSTNKTAASPPPDLKVVAGTALGTNSALTDQEESVLFFQHLRRYNAAVEVFKAAQADLRNVGKKAKADLGEHAVALLKIANDLREDKDGEKKLQERLEREARVARWMGMPIGAQGTLFQPDRRTAEDIAHQEGFAAGADPTTPKKLPERYASTSMSGIAWMKGFDDAQTVLFEAMAKKGDPVLRAPSIGDAEPTAPEAKEEAPSTQPEDGDGGSSEDTETEGEA